MKKHIFAILLLASSAQSGVNAIPSEESASKSEASSLNSVYNAGPAEFVAYKFITCYQEKNEKIEQLIMRLAAPVGGFILGNGVAKLPFRYLKNSFLNIIVRFIGVGVGVYAGKESYFLAKKGLKRKIDRSILKEFLSNWNQYQNDTPVELHGYFDNLAEEYQKDRETVLKNAVQINKEIRRKIQPLRFRTQ
jgi:hypothetical protein